MTLLDDALKYADYGFPVFPCVPGEKRPLCANGCKDATDDASQVERWWTEHPNANIGLSTDGLIVVDVDPMPDGSANPWLADQPDKLRELAAAPMAVTPRGGRHYFFKAPGAALRNTAGKIAPHVDTRADGGYVVAAPSTVDGRAYRWVNEPDSADQLPDPPAWLLALLNPSKPAKTTTDTSGEVFAHGKRNSSLASLAGLMRYGGMTPDEICHSLLDINQRRCRPPLEQSEVENIARSIGRYDAPRGDDNSGLLVCLDTVEAENVQWLWPDRIALRKLTLLIGDPGLGKSFLTMDFAARVSAGLPWPDAPGAANPSGSVILLSAEDDLADTIRPRLDAAGANPSKVYALQGVEYEKGTRSFSLDSDLPILEQAIASCGGDCRLVVIDPVSAYLGDTDSHKNAEIRGLLGPLKDLAERHNVAVLAVTHLNKAGGQSALYRATGSLAFIAAARAGWLVAKDKDDEARRLFLSVKNNLAQEPSGLAFRIVDGRVQWDATPINVTADAALSEDDKDRPQSERNDAADWLRGLLADGPIATKDIELQADAAGYSWATVRRAKSHANIVAEKEHGGAGRWVWVLPGYGLGKSLNQDAHSTPVVAA